MFFLIMASKSNMNCCVPQCFSTKKKDNTITFHRFPNNIREKWKWKLALRIGKEISDRMTVCSKHFQETDFFRPGPKGTRRKLKRFIIPSRCLPITPSTTSDNKVNITSKSKRRYEEIERERQSNQSNKPMHVDESIDPPNEVFVPESWEDLEILSSNSPVSNLPTETGAGAKTHKPVLYTPDRQLHITAADLNNEKIIFISEENNVDYREVKTTNGHSSPLKNSGIIFDNVNQNTVNKKFPWSGYLPSTNEIIPQADIVNNHTLPTATFATIQDDSSSDYDSYPCELLSNGSLLKTCKKLTSEIKDLQTQLQEKDNKIRDLEEQLRYFKTNEKS